MDLNDTSASGLPMIFSLFAEQGGVTLPSWSPLAAVLAAVMLYYFRVSLLEGHSTARSMLSKAVSLVSLHRQPKGFSVNYHFLRACNYNCKFCFHTAKTSRKLPIAKAKEGLRRLAAIGMEKINFAGGEPFLEPRMLGELVRFCKEELHLCVSIVSNGSKIQEVWMRQYAQFVNMLTVSIDSFDDATNTKIGRASRSTGQAQQTHLVSRVAELCMEYNVSFRINTVVCAYNKSEDMCDSIAELAPFRWKVFQVLALDGENKGEGALRDVTPYLVTDEEYQSFIARHQARMKQAGITMIAESNEVMKDSYVMLDEDMNFLDCRDGGKTKLGAQTALDGSLDDLRHLFAQLGHDKGAFSARDGYYYQALQDATTGCGSGGSGADLF